MPASIRGFFARFLSVEDDWFGFDPTSHADADVVNVFQSPVAIAGAPNRVFLTHVLDLQMSEDRLWEGMEKGTRYEIRRAEKDNLKIEFLRTPTSRALAQFAADYQVLAQRKDLAGLDERRIKRLMRNDGLEVSSAIDASGNVLAWHAYVRRNERARLLHSISNLAADASSAHRALVGRANRYLHWCDIRHFKDSGLKIYDLGGYYPGTEDQQQAQIARFKRGFGGRSETGYNATLALTGKGRLALRIALTLRSG